MPSSPISSKAETPDTVHGRLLESVHLSGYSFERACGELTWLLDKDRWKSVGRGYKHIDDFLNTLSMPEFKTAIEQRKQLAKRLEVLRATQKAIGKMMGVSDETVTRDLGKRATNVAQANAATLNPPEKMTPESFPATNVATAWFQSDVDPSREAKRTSNREQQQAERQAQRTAMAATARAATVGEDFNIHHGDFRTLTSSLADSTFDLVFTDPPYDDVFLPTYADIGTVAARLLRVGGSLITYAPHHRVPEVIAMLQAAGLTFFWPLAVMYTSGNLARMTEYGIIVHWKPLLWFVKGTFRSREDMRFVHDVIESPQAEKTHHVWQQEIASARYYIEMLTPLGGLVLDPFCGGGTTAAAAALAGRQCITYDIDEESVWIARQRLRECHG